MKHYLKFFPYVILLISLVSVLVSLFFSEIMKLPPCILCWYQRIAMYPIVAITAVGILLKDRNLPLYILPLGIIGWGIALYHNFLYYHIIPESIAPCQQGVSCTTQFFKIFGFMDIPLGSFIAFTLLCICTIIYLKYQKKV